MKKGLQKIILTFTVAAMQGCWLYALVYLFSGLVPAVRFHASGLAVFFALAFVLNKVTTRLEMPGVKRRLAIWAVWLLGVPVLMKICLYGESVWLEPGRFTSFVKGLFQPGGSVTPELFLMALSAVTWWLGVRHGRVPFSFERAVREFQIGLAALIILNLIAAKVNISTDPLVSVTIVFFVFSLMSLSLTHALEGQAWLSGPDRMLWSALLLGSIVLILLAGLLIEVTINPGLLKIIFSYFIISAGFVWDLFLKFMAFLNSFFPAPEPLKPVDSNVPDMSLGPGGSHRGFRIPTLIRTLIGFLMSSFWTILFLVVIWKVSSGLIGWVRTRLKGDEDAELEYIPGAFRADIIRFLKAVFMGIRDLITSMMRIFAPGGKHFKRRKEFSSLRQIYRDMIKWESGRGYELSPFQTPYEYLEILIRNHPDGEREFRTITENYVRARYSTWEPPEDVLNRTKICWERIKKSIFSYTDNDNNDTLIMEGQGK